LDELIEKINRITKVLIPGPINPIDEVRKAASINVFSHRSEEFSLLYAGIEDYIKRIIGGSKDVDIILMPGSSTLGIESIFTNILTPKDRVLVLKQGYFGEWMENIVKRYSDNVEILEAKYGETVDPGIVVDRVKEGGYDVVGVVHYETSTGTAVRYLDLLGKASSETGSILVVDGVSSVGAEKIEMSKWGINAIATGSQKCLGAYPGLSIIALDKKIIDEIYNKSRNNMIKPPFYMDLKKYIEFKEKYGWTVTTPPINNVVGLYVSLKKIIEYGIDNYFDLHKKRCIEIYDYAEQKGLEPFVKNQSIRAYSVAVFKVNNAESIVSALKNTYGFLVATGLGKYRDVLIRIGIMGFTPTNVVKEAINYIVKIINDTSVSMQ